MNTHLDSGVEGPGAAGLAGDLERAGRQPELVLDLKALPGRSGEVRGAAIVSDVDCTSAQELVAAEERELDSHGYGFNYHVCLTLCAFSCGAQPGWY
ncbi:MAG: hypothetical protein KC492_00140, partial [Myxococcales bacterium]|nr:hypothetical protein [Myxococcales bacterium]